MGKIERLILQHSNRGMELLRDCLSEDFCAEAAAEILRWERGTVVLTTGFYVADHAVGLISVERCGTNIHGDYANMRGVSIAAYTAPIDQMFAMAACPTVGIGDGGNEIGMGCLAQQIAQRLSLVPCRAAVDHLILATVSNWGALGLAAALGQLPEEETFLQAYEAARELGFVDGVTGICALGEDGFPLQTGQALLLASRQ